MSNLVLIEIKKGYWIASTAIKMIKHIDDECYLINDEYKIVKLEGKDNIYYENFDKYFKSYIKDQNII